ncbi:MAG: hypothetical protein Q7R94_02800 [bacterium]|nr:hypothetical protein [bacterium]
MKEQKKQKLFLFSIFYFLDFRTAQSTLEVVIALTLLTVALTGAAVVAISSQSLSIDAQEANQTIRLAEQNLENLRANARYDFNGIASSTVVENEFTKIIIVTTTTDPNTKQVVSRVTWKTDSLRTQSVELVTLVTNWSVAQDSGDDTGGGGTTGDWTNPQTLGTVDLGAGEEATGLDVRNKIVYMTATASDKKKADFFIVDATNGQSPVVNTSLNTGLGLNAIDIAGDYAYVANDDTSEQLQIIDVSSNSTSSVVSTTTLAGVSGSGAIGNSIFYSGSKVYIGTKRATGPEFHIIDVSSPTSTSELGSFEIDADVNSISISGNTAYIATSDDNTEVVILNVSNPASIVQLGAFNATSTYDGKSLYRVGSKIYFGRKTGNSDELQVLDVSSSSAPSSLGVKSIAADVNSLVVRDKLAFIGTSDSNNEFQVYDISTPAAISFVSSFNFPQVAASIDFEDNIVYVAVRSNDALRIITSQ